MPPNSNIMEALCGGAPPPMACAVGPPSPRSKSIEMELAIALTNANINSGRVVIRPPQPTHGPMRKGKAAAAVSASVPADMFRRGLVRHAPFFVGCNSRQRSSSDVHVVWSRPLEIEAGPGYSPGGAADRSRGRVCARRAGDGCPCAACLQQRGGQFVAAPESSAADTAAAEAALGAGAHRRARVAARSAGRLRIELCARLGVLDLRSPETWPAGGLPQSVRGEAGAAAGGQPAAAHKEGQDSGKGAPSAAWQMLASPPDAAAATTDGSQEPTVTGSDSASATDTDACRSASQTPVSSFNAFKFFRRPSSFSASFPAPKASSRAGCTAARCAADSALLSPEAEGFLHVAGGYF
jgi:hypothetical protein